MINGQSAYEVRICKFAAFGEAEERFVVVRAHDVEYDDLTIDGRVPKFSFKLTNLGGIARITWRQSDIVRIYKNKKLVFTGSIDSTKPEKGEGGQTYTISGVHYYYRVAIDSLTNTASELEGSGPNTYRFGRKKLDNGTETGELVDGINAADIVKVLAGNKMVVQEFFDNMDGIDNITWSKNSEEFVDYTSRVTNPGFETAIGAEWVGFQKKVTPVTGTLGTPLFGNEGTIGNSGKFGTQGRIANNAKTGVYSYQIVVPATSTMKKDDGGGIYQDGIALDPGDTILASFKSVDNGIEISSGNISARIYVFEDGTFDHPISATANIPLVVGGKSGGVTNVYTKIGGVPDIKVSGDYRVCFLFVWTAADATTNVNTYLRIDDVKIIRANNFNSVQLLDGFLQLKEVSSSDTELLFDENFEDSPNGHGLTGWSQSATNGSIALVADTRFTPSQQAVRLVSDGTGSTSQIFKTFSRNYSEQFTLKFEARAAQVNKTCYPIVLQGYDKDGDLQTVVPLSFGSDGTFRRFDTDWALFSDTGTDAVYGIWSKSRILSRACGANGKFYKWDGAALTTTHTVGSDNIRAIWDVDSDDIWAVGDNGKFYHFDGTAWTLHTTLGTSHIRAVYGFGSANVWAVGDGGKFYHYDGEAWTLHTTLTNGINSIWGANRNDIWAVGAGGRFYRYDGTAWTEVVQIGASDIYTIHGIGAGDIWAAGDDGKFYYYDGVAWVLDQTLGTDSVRSISGPLTDSMCGVGLNGKFYKYDGTDWTQPTTVGIDHVHSVFMLNPFEAIAVGDSLRIYRKNLTGSSQFKVAGVSVPYVADQWYSFSVKYYPNVGKYSMYIDDAFVGSFYYGYGINESAIINFAYVGARSSDSLQAATIEVNDYLVTPLDAIKTSATIGTAQTIDYYPGNPVLKKLPYFTGATTVRVLGYPYHPDPAVPATVYKPKLKLIYKQHNYFLPSVPAATETTGFLTPTETLLSASGLTEYLYTFDTSTLAVPSDKIRLEFTLETDVAGRGTPKIDYFRLDAPIESYTRQVKLVNGQQVYRGSITGLSADLSEIEEYTFPNDLLGPGTPPTLYNTFALEFFQQPLLAAMTEVLANTLKPELLGSDVLTNLPDDKLLDIQDSNWDFQISHTGVVRFKKHIGNYYGKLAGSVKREYSFRNKNLRALSLDEDGNGIINQLVYVGQGIGGINNLVIDGIKDDDSINRHGLRVGRVTEKRVFDATAAVGRAYAILRERREPALKVSVELLPSFADTWEVGDIIYIRDLDSDINDDFRVLSKTTKVSGTDGETVTVELSTKNKTVQGFVSSLGTSVNSLSNANQGVSFSAVGGGVPKSVSRDTPYVLQVEIPEDAETTLIRVLLDAHSEAISTTSTTLAASDTHAHDFTIPALPFEFTIPAQSITIPNSNPHDHVVNAASALAVDAPTSGIQQQNSYGAFSVASGGVANLLTVGTSINITDIEEVVFFYQFIASDDNVDWYTNLILNTDIGDVEGLDTDFYASLDNNVLITKRLPFTASELKRLNITTINYAKLEVRHTDTVTRSAQAASVQLFTTPSHNHDISAITLQERTVTTPAATNPQQIVDSTTEAFGTTTDGGGSHNHESAFTIKFNRDTNGNLLFPTNISVSVNDIVGIGEVVTVGNAGSLPDLVGLGKHELGDDKDISQKSGFGFRLAKYDISHAFKNSSGNWIPGTHYLFFNAVGNDNQVNHPNVGILQASVFYDIARRYNSDLVRPASGPQL